MNPTQLATAQADLPAEPHITLEQWRALIAVADAGSFAAAAERLYKSQSSVSYLIARIEDALPVTIFRREGRRATLTEAGDLLVRRARRLVDEAGGLERLAGELAAGWEAEVCLAVEAIFPVEHLLDALTLFDPVSRGTRVRLIESVLTGTEEALISGHADLAVTGRIPAGFLGDALARVDFVAVAHPDHPLHHLGRNVEERDLHTHRQVVVRDTGVRRQQDAGWLEAPQRWTVSQLSTSVAILRRQLGFAWVPEHAVASDLAARTLVPLPLREGSRRSVELYLVYADREAAGPAARALASSLQAVCNGHPGR